MGLKGAALAGVGTTVDLASSEVTGTLPVANGGTGAATLTSKNVILGEGTSAVSFVAPGTSGNVLKSNGTTWTSGTVSATVTVTTDSLTGNFTTTSTTFVIITGLSITLQASGKYMVVFSGNLLVGNAADTAVIAFDHNGTKSTSMGSSQQTSNIVCSINHVGSSDATALSVHMRSTNAATTMTMWYGANLYVPTMSLIEIS